MFAAVGGVGCDFSASTKVISDETGTLDDTGTGAENTDSGEPPVETGDAGNNGNNGGDNNGGNGDSGGGESTDDDGDGWSVEAGDCDDANPTVHPGATDGCDGLDSDCDGAIDEDSVDAYEPNDTSAYDLGSLEDDTSRAVTATLTSSADVDRYRFSIVDDLTDFFTVVATVSNIPSGSVYRFTLNRLYSVGDSDLGEVTSVSGTGTLTLSFSDETFVEDGGDYELVVEAESAVDCARSYLLAVAQ